VDTSRPSFHTDQTRLVPPSILTWSARTALAGAPRADRVGWAPRIRTGAGRTPVSDGAGDGQERVWAEPEREEARRELARMGERVEVLEERLPTIRNAVGDSSRDAPPLLKTLEHFQPEPLHPASSARETKP
jgi:hypothetical protein